MSAPRPGSALPAARPVAVRLFSLPLAVLLGGCSEPAASLGAWGFAAVALVLVAAGGLALGGLRARAASDRGLRSLQGELRQWQALHTGWAWRTDAQHAVQAWHGPGRAPAAACVLFEDAALQACLRARQAFGPLRVQAASLVDGSRSWELRGVPRSDDLGRFAGFGGVARPCDDELDLQQRAGALQGVLDAHTAAAVVATDAGSGWLVRQLNAGAATTWPQLHAGAPLAPALAGLPEAVARAVQDLQPGQAPLDAQGWRLAAPQTADGTRCLVLLQQAAPPAAATVEAGESDNFSFTVTHDLRAPIRVVEGFTRIVKEDYGRLLDRVGNDHLDRVLGAASRMNLMIDALLTLARLSSQPLARQPVNLSQLASYVIDDLRRSAPEREADISIEPGLATVGDPTLLRLVLENLLGNAWKYSARTARAQISLASLQHAGRRAYVVRDNGAGFDMRSADRLFGLFQRLHSASDFPGHGVGLASVRRIVRRHGGDIWAEAEPGRGAAFFFTLGG